MLKTLATILIFISCSWTAQSQVSLPFREDAPIATDLYWTKAFDFLEAKRFGELQTLMDVLIKGSLGRCKDFDQVYGALVQALENKNQDALERALTEFITKSIVYEINYLSNIEDVKRRKEIVLNLFKELIAIQKYIKDLDFDTYRQLVNCFRRLNQVYSDTRRLEQFIDRQDYLAKYALKC